MRSDLRFTLLPAIALLSVTISGFAGAILLVDAGPGTCYPQRAV
jgi:uncharacterized protein YraI